MAHEIARLILEHAESFLERAEAIETALSLGMPLHEIEEYLDWLDSLKSEKKQELTQPPAIGAEGTPSNDEAEHGESKVDPNSRPAGPSPGRPEETSRDEARGVDPE